MSDNRRRRKSQQSGGSDDLSDSYEELNATKETQSSEHTEDHHDPAYDAGNESNSESQDSFQDGEYNKRESGDGQEEDKPQKKLDDDEDRRNPQYIPKRGTFYEHDDRTAEKANDETVEPQPEREAKEKKVWKDKEDRWDHDRYNDEEQAPKSHAELIAVYGYDIRNEEGPPRARRRRKYGRGPNKYTRNWEDEDAYGKVAGTVPTNKPNNTRKVNRTGEEFPLLNPKDKDDSPKTEEQPVITSAWYSNKNKIHPNKTQNFPPLQTENQKAKPKLFTNSQANENKAPNERNNTAWKREPKNTPYIQNANNTTVATADTEKIVIVKTAPRENKRPTQVQESVSLASSKSRGRGFKANANNNIVGNRTIESKPKGRGPGPLSIPVDIRRSNVEHEQIINDMKHMNVSTEGPSYHHAARQNKHFYTQPSSQHSTVVPPRMQPSHPQQQPPPPQQPPQPQQPPPQQDIASNRPKRYSSLRQRPLIADGPPTPTQPNYQPAPQHTYYPPPQAGSSRAVLESPGYPPGPYEQTPAPAAPMGGQPVIPIPPGAQPASYAPHAPPPFLVPTPQFIPSQTAPPSIINYVAGPNGPIFQPNYQGYNPAAVQPGPPPPQEVGLYQPQGCTYYSPAQQQQQQQQQPVPLRRPKAAIPILPPPDNLQNPNNRGRPRSLQPQSQMPPQDPQQQQQLQQQQQQEQLVQQQLQQHQQQLIQEQQQERQQQEQLLQQQQQQKQQELQQQQQKQQELQQQQQKKQQEQQKQQQEQPQKQLKQEQPQQPPKQEQPQQPLKQEQPQQSQQPEQKQIPESEQQQKPEQEQKQVPEQDQHVEKPEELKQEPQQEQSQKPQQEQPQKLQQEQQQEPLKKEQQEPQQKEQEKPQVQDDSNSDKLVSKPVETLETTIKTVDKIESVVNDDSSVLANTKDNLEQKLESIVLEDKSLKDSEEKILEPVVTEAAVEQKETLTKVEVVIPDVIPNAVEEKITAPAVTEVSLVMTTVLEEKTDKSVSNCVIESNAILASEEVKGVSTNTAELVSSKSETDCSIKESAVIEEAAA